MRSAVISMRTFETEKSGDECLTVGPFAIQRRARFMALSSRQDPRVFCRSTARRMTCLLQRHSAGIPAGYPEIVLLSIHRAQITIALIVLIKCDSQIYAAESGRASKRVLMARRTIAFAYEISKSGSTIAAVR